MIVINITLSDIPKDRIRTGDNGKKYASFVVDERKEADQYGNTHSVSMSQSKEEREAKSKKVYVGSGKAYSFDKKTTTTQHDDLDLPF